MALPILRIYQLTEDERIAIHDTVRAYVGVSKRCSSPLYTGREHIQSAFSLIRDDLDLQYRSGRFLSVEDTLRALRSDMEEEQARADGDRHIWHEGAMV